MRPIQTVIFDMDGVLVDSEPLHERAFLEVFQKMGYGTSHGFHFPDYYGKSDKALWLDFIAKHKPAQTLAELTAWKEDRFLKLLHQDRPIFESIPGLVARLSQRFPLGLASGSAHSAIHAVLELAGLRQFFGAVVSADDVPNGKPAPDIFLRTAELLRVDPVGCCVIEDSAAGVNAALAAGMQVIAITNSLPREQLSHATRVVGTYPEIEALLSQGGPDT